MPGAVGTRFEATAWGLRGGAPRGLNELLIGVRSGTRHARRPPRRWGMIHLARSSNKSPTAGVEQMAQNSRWIGPLAGALLLSATLVAPGFVRAEGKEECKSTVTGDLRLHTLKSTIFGNARTVRVLVPPDYDAPANAKRRYPVLYLLDGQNLFDACLSEVSHREWGVDETVYRLFAEHAIPPMIVVGIDHAGKDRAVEYLPYKDYVGNPSMPEPAGRPFPDFLTDEVMPLVVGQYRTLPGHANTGIGGSSYGGVACSMLCWRSPARSATGCSRARQSGSGWASWCATRARWSRCPGACSSASAVANRTIRGKSRRWRT